jgi:hypothetical protein
MITCPLSNIEFTEPPEERYDYEALLAKMNIPATRPILLDATDIVIAKGREASFGIRRGNNLLAAIGYLFGSDVQVSFTPSDQCSQDDIDAAVTYTQGLGIFGLNDYLSASPVPHEEMVD